MLDHADNHGGQTSSHNTPTISAILTAHAEGALASVSYKSLQAACQYSRQQGIETHQIIMLDRPSAATRKVFEGLDDGTSVLETDFGDQGLVRNAAIEHSEGDYVAFLDGDDLWSENWLYEAAQFLRSHSSTTIAHPEFNWFFGGVSNVLINIDQDDPLFAQDFLRFGNYWDAMCMTHRSTYTNHPYCQRRIKDGFAFEDWHWNCQTYESGCVHKVIKDTIHFKRRRTRSQTIEASGTKSIIPDTRLTSYAYKHNACAK